MIEYTDMLVLISEYIPICICLCPTFNLEVDLEFSSRGRGDEKITNRIKKIN